MILSMPDKRIIQKVIKKIPIVGATSLEDYYTKSEVDTLIGVESPWDRDTTNGYVYPHTLTDRVGIGTNAPDSIFHIKANVSGTVGSHPAGQLIIQDPDDSVFGNAVITGYESDGAGNPDQQLWYLGSSSSSNAEITFLNRRNAKLHLGTNGVSRLTILGNGNVGIGVTDPDTELEILNAGNQLKLSFDGTDNTIFAVDTSGDLTITPSGSNVIIAGDIGITGTRVTKGWFTDLECTNDITIGGTALAATYAAIAQTMYIGTTQVAINRASAALTLAGITLTTPDIGTPSAGVLTNCSGTAAGLTAGNVTTNANLTGIVTSTGNATAIANKAIAIAKLADGTDGNLITWDADGVIAAVATGDAGQVLTSGGAGVAPTFAAAGAADNLGNHIATQDLVSDTADTDSLGSTTKEWLNLYIGDAGKIYLGLGQDASIERSAANEMTLIATSGVTVEGVKIDGGVVTGASSITSTAFVGDLTGDITGDAATCSGEAATVATITGLAPDTATTQATQGNITSLGTLTTLTVDNININGSAITGLTAAATTIDANAGQSVTIEGVTFDGGVIGGATLTTPDCGTPSAIVLTNASGTVTNLTLVTPALGTPASGVLTNCTALPAAQVAAGTFAGALEAADHGTAATDELVNVSYGIGEPPTANTTTIGSLFIKYTA